MKSPEGFRNEDPIENHDEVDSGLTRRRILKGVGVLGISLFVKDALDPFEAVRGMTYLEGIKEFRKQVMNSPVETGAFFVKPKGREGKWHLPVYGEQGILDRSISPVIEKFGLAMRERGIEFIIRAHIHNLDSAPETFEHLGINMVMIKQIKEGKGPLLSFPPSRRDTFTFLEREWCETIKREYGMDARQSINMVADPVGIWKFHLDENPKSKYNMRERTEQEVTAKYKEIFTERIKMLPANERQKAENDFAGNNLSALATYLQPEDLPLHYERLEIERMGHMRWSRFDRVRDSFIRKSIQHFPKLDTDPAGENISQAPEGFEDKDYQELLEVYAERGFAVSFTSYKELGLEK